MKCLITGANGLIGRILVEHLVAGGHTVVATDVRADFSNDWKKSGVIFQSLEILDQAAVLETVRQTQPDWIFHLAAQSLPNVSWEKPALTFEEWGTFRDAAPLGVWGSLVGAVLEANGLTPGFQKSEGARFRA